MDSKRHEHSSKSNTESPPAPPSPPMYSASYTTYDGYKNRMSLRRSPSPSDYRRSRNDSPQERRRRRRSSSKSPLPRSHRRSRSSDREKDRERDRERSRKYSRRDRSRSRSRGRSRSRDRRRSRSRNRSRDRHRGRESRRYHRAPSYESDTAEDNTETIIPQPVVPPQSNAFKNDGSFMEMFKKMQEQMQPPQKPTTSVMEEKTVVPPPLMVGKRRGGRILKTGMVAKPKTEQTVEQPKDAWSLYMAEVKKYREVCCQEEDNTRPLQHTMVKYTEIGTPKVLPTAPSDVKDLPSTAPYDPRFPNQNQTRHCYTSFLDFQRCKNRHSEEHDVCQYFQKVTKVMCPNAWIEKWNEQIDMGTFPVKI